MKTHINTQTHKHTYSFHYIVGILGKIIFQNSKDLDFNDKSAAEFGQHTTVLNLVSSFEKRLRQFPSY